MTTGKLAAAAVMLAALGLGGCGGDMDKAVARADASMKAVGEAGTARLQGELDDATEDSLIQRGKWGSKQVAEWNTCKTDPPEHERGKKACAQLRQQLNDEEKRSEEKEAKRKTNW
jgi:hypothetical protein